MSNDYREDLRLAIDLAREASRIALRGDPGRVSTKSDGTPVTDVDLAIDEMLALQLARSRPADGLLSEERSECFGENGRRWVIDPVDGTSRYVAGGRDWGTLLALEDAGRVVVAAMTRPTEGLLWLASRGGGAFVTGIEAAPSVDAKRVLMQPPSAQRPLRMARGLLEPDTQLPEQLSDLEWVGDEVSAIAALLAGMVDAVIDDLGKMWDQAAPCLLVQEAGGGFWDPTGGCDPSTGWGLYASVPARERLWTRLARHGHVSDTPSIEPRARSGSTC